MGHKAKVWGVWLIVIIVVTIIRVAYFGGGIEAFFVALLFNLIFWLFLIMFIVRLVKPGDAPLSAEDHLMVAVGKIISDWENTVANMTGVSDDVKGALKNATPKVYEGKLIIVAANKADYDKINNDTTIMNIQSDISLKSKTEIPTDFAYFDENQQICQTKKSD